jgi:hypothetical protein
LPARIFDSQCSGANSARIFRIADREAYRSSLDLDGHKLRFGIFGAALRDLNYSVIKTAGRNDDDPHSFESPEPLPTVKFS